MDATGEGGGRGREGGREEGVECQMKRQQIYKKKKRCRGGRQGGRGLELE